nr:hypothetical protein [Tanacetum cinerariifolium]
MVHIHEPGDPDREVLVVETFHERTDDELTEKEVKQMEVDDRASQTILIGIPEYIYVVVDSCETAQEIWLHIQQMMKGSDIGIQEKRLNPTTVMNMSLILMAKEFKLNYSTQTNNNQRISSNPRNRQIAQLGMNLGQERQMQMVGDGSAEVPSKVVEMNDLSNLVTLNSVPITKESKVVKNDNVISLGMFRINPSKTSKEDKFMPINQTRASVRKNPITVSQPHVITMEDVNSVSNGLSSTRIENIAKTRRTQARSNTKNDRVPSAFDSSCIKNKKS